MIAKNVTMGHMIMALERTNARYGGNIKFKVLEEKGRRIHFTLTVDRTSEGTGKAKVGLPGVSIKRGRRIAAACWHVHGDFFDALFKMVPDAEIVSLGKTITRDHGNWKDWNVGSLYEPLMASQACECHRNYRTERILAAQRGV